MALIRQYHRDSNTTYVYSSESYWDPVKKQARSKRKCIGKIDPATGEIIPTGKRGRQKNTEEKADPEIERLNKLYDAACQESESLKKQIGELEKQIADLSRQNRKMLSLIKKVHDITAD